MLLSVSVTQQRSSELGYASSDSSSGSDDDVTSAPANHCDNSGSEVCDKSVNMKPKNFTQRHMGEVSEQAEREGYECYF